MFSKVILCMNYGHLKENYKMLNYLQESKLW